MDNKDNIAMVGDTLDTIFMYPDGWQEESSFYLSDFNSDEEVPINRIPIQSRIGQAVYKKKVNSICEIEGSPNKILITAIHKKTKNMGYQRTKTRTK